MSYETLDTIADSYIPLLFVLFVVGLLSILYKRWPDYLPVVKHFCFLMSVLIVSYGLMFFDNATHLWPRFGLDYSTHTAVALSVVFALCALFPRHWIWIAISMLAYAGLMLYQRYHSVADIVSTSIVLAIFSIILFTFVIGKSPKTEQAV